MTFSPVEAAEKLIRVAEDQNFQFAAKRTTCVPSSTVWRLGDLDEKTGRRYVTVGGVSGNPGVGTVGNWFKIEPSGKDYKLVFCPTVCKFCKVICGKLGVFNENGARFLGLNGQPFPVMFKKA